MVRLVTAATGERAKLSGSNMTPQELNNFLPRNQLPLEFHGKRRNTTWIDRLAT